MNSAPTIRFRIWIAGDYQAAIQACREFCEEGLCVSVHPTAYVYTGGMEDGVCVTLINYPRFPSTDAEISERASRLAEHLRQRLYQDSYTIEGPKKTVWFSRRSDL